jgi:hypothetical protein
MWNAPIISNATGGGLDTPEKAIKEAKATHEIMVPYGECTNNDPAHRQAVYGFSMHDLKIGCTYNMKSEIVPTQRALLLMSTGVEGIAKKYIAEKADYAKAYADILDRDTVKVKALAVQDDEKLVADRFIASAEEYAANFREVLIPTAKNELHVKINILQVELDTAVNEIFPDESEKIPPEIDLPEIEVPEIELPEIEEPEIDNPIDEEIESNIMPPKSQKTKIVRNKIAGMSKNSLPEVGFVPGKIITEKPAGAQISNPSTPQVMLNPEMSFSHLWIWGLVADFFAFVIVFIIILWRRKQRINAGEDIF